MQPEYPPLPHVAAMPDSVCQTNQPDRQPKNQAAASY
jgi:hypothetical protein